MPRKSRRGATSPRVNQHPTRFSPLWSSLLCRTFLRTSSVARAQNSAHLPRPSVLLAEIIPRAVCSRCERPDVVCLCEALGPTAIATQTRVVILQHPRESDVPINTARLVELQLESAERHVGIHLSEAPALRARLSDPAAPPILLYPGEDARDLGREPPTGPVTLVVLDGTWWQAKKLFQKNPELAALPRYSLSPSAPSRYRIRREPALHCISTIEAIADALSLLEPGGFDREGFLGPFDAMVAH